MGEMIRISDEAYALLEQRAKTALETLDRESINSLRATCIIEAGKLVSCMVEAVEKMKAGIHNILTVPVGNPFRNLTKRFWLIQLGNFIATFFFKVPRELTPSVGFPWRASKLAKEWDERGKTIDDRLLFILEHGSRFTESNLPYFREIRDKIMFDDTKLIIFCQSCGDTHYGDLPMAASPHFKQMAALVYRNNISFPSDLYDEEVKASAITDNLAKMASFVSEQYKRAAKER